MTLLLTSSATRNSPITQNSIDQPGSTATDEGDGKERGQERTEIGDEAQDGGQHAPQHGVRHADDVEGKADGDAVGEVHDQLHEQVAAHPPGRIVEGVRALLEVSRAGELDEAIPQVLLLEQHEDHEDDDEARRGDRGQQRADHGLDHFERLRLGALQPDGQGLTAGRTRPESLLGPVGGLAGAGDLLAEILQGGRDLVDEAAAGGRGLKRPDLVRDGRLVGWQVLGELDELPPDDERDAADQDEGEAHGDQDGGDPWQLQPAQPVHKGCQGEPEEDRQRERDEDVAAEIQPPDGKNDPARGQK